MFECSIIIPVFNQLCYTKECIDSVLEYTSDINIEIIIINNGSLDGTKEYLDLLASKNSNIKVVHFVDNKGYSEANNYGALNSNSNLLLFLNNDTIVTKNWLNPLLETINDPSVGIVGSKLLYPSTNRINHAGYVYNDIIGCFYPIYHDANSNHIGVNKKRDFQALLGACILVKKELFISVGLFSSYGLEDIDLCLKIKEKGYKIVYEPKSEVYHHGSVTLKGSKEGTFLQTDVNSFSKRRPKGSIESDDIKYYKEDGYEILKASKGSIPTLKDLITTSYEFMVLASNARNKGDFQEAIILLKDALKNFPNNAEAHSELISTFLEISDLKMANEAAKDFLNACPDSEDAKYTLEKLLMSQCI